MKLSEYMDMMEADAVIDATDLTRESLVIPQLSAKYNRYLIQESRLLKSAEVMLSRKELELFKYYTGDGTDEQYQTKKAINKRIPKSEAHIYVKSDEDYITVATSVHNQNIKVDLIKDFIRQLNQRTFLIKNAIDNEKFKNGIN